MSEDNLSEVSERVREARAELDTTLTDIQADLARVQEENRTTLEEHNYLQAIALRGDLGADMQELARRIDRGEESWDRVFSGDSPNADLLRGHVERMYAQNAQSLAEAVNEDEEFQQLLQEARDGQPTGDAGSPQPRAEDAGGQVAPVQPADQPEASAQPPRVHGDDWDEDSDFYGSIHHWRDNG